MTTPADKRAFPDTHRNTDRGITLTRYQLNKWAGMALTDVQVARLCLAIPSSSIPDTIGKIASQFTETHRMSPEDAAKQAGCWLEGPRGWTANGELVNIAERHGMPLSLDDRAVVDAYLARADTVTLSNGEALSGEEIGEYITDWCGLAEEAEKYLNDFVAPEDYAFGWRDGEFSLWAKVQRF
ncbi:MAG TPA: hypothetical protein VFX53_05130 [Pedococcus sp.]|nr:hypothetical protein [Pedococcus sp.]